jgi:hypothetical protein
MKRLNLKYDKLLSNVAVNFKLRRYKLVGVYITVWATIDVASHTRDCRVATVSTGFNLLGNTLGNKGGAAVWMKVFSTPVVGRCSVNP